MLFAFGEFELDVRLCVLRRRGGIVPMQPKVFDTLRYLIEHRDHVVSKEELIDALWDGQLVNDVAVPWSIRHARRALGQLGAEPCPIETVRGRGYRFAAAVRPMPADLPGTGMVAPAAPLATARPRPDVGLFLGREDIMGPLLEALNDARAGNGRLCLLTGEAGIGKTRCADELATVARRSGLGVWVGRCSGGGGAPAFWPWIQILRESSEDRRLGAGERKAVEAMLGRLVPSAFAAIEPPCASREPSAASRFWLSESLARCVRQTAEMRVRVLVVEDLHAADEGSLETLALLAPELAMAKMLVVATSRAAPVADASGSFAKRLRPCEVIALSGLTFENVKLFIADAIGRAPPPELVRSVHAKTAGNPLFVKEAVRVVAARWERQGTLLAEDVALPDVARGFLHDRIATLDSETRAVLDAASVIGEAFELSVLMRVVDISTDHLLARLDAAVQSRIAEPRAAGHYAFAHALYREVLEEALPVAERTRLHARVAGVLRSVSAVEPKLRAIAYHLHHALPDANAKDVARYSRLAGDSALHGFAYREAAEFYGWALGALSYADAPDARLSCELLLSAAYALRRIGRIDEARDHGRRAIEIAQRENFADLLVDAARSLRATVWVAHVPDALVLGALEQARAVLPDEAKAARARAYSLLATIPPHASSAADSRALSERALQIARELGDRQVLLEALVSTLHSLSGPDSLDELLARADEILRLDGSPVSWWSAEAFFGRYNALLQRGDIVAAERALEAFGECARRLRMSEAIWQYERVRAQRAMYDGDFERAEARFNELLAMSDGFRNYGMFQYAALMNALSWERTGRPLSLPAFALGTSPDISWQWAAAIPAFRAERILILLGAGDRGAARSEFEDMAKDDFQNVTRDLAYLYALCRFALAAVALNRREEALVLYARLRPYSERNAIDGLSLSLGSVAHFLGILARFLGNHAEACAHFEDAIAMNVRLGHKVHAQRSQLALAELVVAAPSP